MWRAPGDFDEIRSREAAFLSCAGDTDGGVCGCSTEYQAVQTVSGACGLTPRLQLRLMFAGCACTYCTPAGVAQRGEADRRVAVGADSSGDAGAVSVLQRTVDICANDNPDTECLSCMDEWYVAYGGPVCVCCVSVGT